MKSGKSQSIMTIGLGLIIIGALIIGFALSQPKILVTSTSDASVSYQSDEETTTVPDTPQSASVTYPLNLNTCTYDELMSVDGIGETKANLILEYRDYLGGYSSVEQLKDIKGIGDETYERIAPYFTV